MCCKGMASRVDLASFPKIRWNGAISIFASVTVRLASLSDPLPNVARRMPQAVHHFFGIPPCQNPLSASSASASWAATWSNVCKPKAIAW